MKTITVYLTEEQLQNKISSFLDGTNPKVRSFYNTLMQEFNKHQLEHENLKELIKVLQDIDNFSESWTSPSS